MKTFFSPRTLLHPLELAATHRDAMAQDKGLAIGPLLTMLMVMVIQVMVPFPTTNLEDEVRALLIQLHLPEMGQGPQLSEEQFQF